MYHVITAERGRNAMNGWNDGITSAIAYIEENLTEEIDIDTVAEKAYVSSFYRNFVLRISK
jgi:AraC-like DNA-binding protein